MPAINGPVPAAGRIIGCNFPYENAPTSPGPDFRPCIVVRAEEDLSGKFLVVVYGSGQGTTALHGKTLKSTQFELEPGVDGNTLDVQTRFNCKKVVRLPFNTEWFHSKQGKMAYYGSLSDAAKDQVRTKLP